MAKLKEKLGMVKTPDEGRILENYPKKVNSKKFQDIEDLSDIVEFNDSEMEDWTDYEYDSDDYSSEDEYEEYSVNLKF